MSRIFGSIGLPGDLRVEIGKDRLSYLLGGQSIGGHHLPKGVRVNLEDSVLTIDSNDKAMLGTACALVRNWIDGAAKGGYFRELEVLGIGYWVKSCPGGLEFKLGYSHQIYYPLPEGVTVKLTGTRKIRLGSYDKQLLGSVTHDLEVLRPKSPYRRMGVYVVDKAYPEKKGSKS